MRLLTIVVVCGVVKSEIITVQAQPYCFESARFLPAPKDFHIHASLGRSQLNSRQLVPTASFQFRANFSYHEDVSGRRQKTQITESRKIATDNTSFQRPMYQLLYQFVNQF